MAAFLLTFKLVVEVDDDIVPDDLSSTHISELPEDLVEALNDAVTEYRAEMGSIEFTKAEALDPEEAAGY